MKNKTVIIGIDGAPFSLMEKLSRDAVMPNFMNLRKEGTFRRMESSIPDISSVSWSSIITGKNPAEHGVFGFTEMIEGTYTLRFPDFRNLKATPFWNTNGGKNVIINTPFTYPAQKLDGFLISGFVAPEFDRAVYPRDMLPKLKGMGYRVDVDSRKGHLSKTLFFRELFSTLDARVKAYRYLWDNSEWDNFMLVFTGSDRLGHFLWDAYEEPGHEHHQDFLEFFRKVDHVIGEISGKLGPEDTLIIISDHGMERIEETLDINGLLEQEGFLKLGGNPGKRYADMEPGTRAFALDPGRIYLHREGRYPGGSVKKEEEEKILDELVSLFGGLEHRGKKAVRKVYRKEQIYSGNFYGNAPDLVVVPNKGFSLRGTLPVNSGKTPGLTGKHNPEAFLLVKGRAAEAAVPENPSVEDIVNIMEAEDGTL